MPIIMLTLLPNAALTRLLLLLLLFVITFMQGIYNYVPETNHVSRVYCVAAVASLQCVLYVMLFRMLNMFCTFTLIPGEVCVQCSVWLFSVVP